MHEQMIDRIKIVVGDITTLRVDAIVNAANQSLLGGGGVDGAIHRAAGQQLRQHNQQLDGCRTGLAKITPSFNLAQQGVRHIIHTVGPVWQNESAKDDTPLGYTREDVLLASCYTRSLELAAKHNCRSIALPAISTGAYRFPPQRAARIAIGHVLGHLLRYELPHTVIFCCFTTQSAHDYQHALQTRSQWMYAPKR